MSKGVFSLFRYVLYLFLACPNITQAIVEGLRLTLRLRSHDTDMEFFL